MRRGNSLAVQWLGLCTFTAEGRGSVPGGELRCPKPRSMAEKKKREDMAVQDQLAGAAQQLSSLDGACCSPHHSPTLCYLHVEA